MHVFSVQKSIREQHGTLERFTAIVARAHRVGDKERHRAHGPGTCLRRRGCTTKTTSKSSLAVSRIDYPGFGFVEPQLVRIKSIDVL